MRKPPLLIVSLLLLAGQLVRAQEEAAQPIVDRTPFDRVTLNAANQNAVIDAQLLELPDRKVPEPLPTSGQLQLRRLNDPSTLYEIAWSDIAKVELYEQLVLAEAVDYLRKGKLDAAFESLAFLHENYPKLDNLKEVTEQYLQSDAKAAYDKGHYDESLTILSALYDLNPQRPGIPRAIEGISDRLINDKLNKRDFAGARGLLDSLGLQFPGMQLTNISTWQQKFTAGAERQLEVARQALTTGEYSKARQGIDRALAILPDAAGAAELLAELKKQAPQVVVGVSQLASGDTRRPQAWANERVGRLTNPRFVELVRVGSEGGEYACRWAEIRSDDSGLRMELKFNDTARELGITPDRVALQLVQMADRETAKFDTTFAHVFANVEIVGGNKLVITWRYPHIRPEALLQFPLAELSNVDLQQIAYKGHQDSESPEVIMYRRGTDARVTAIREEQLTQEQQSLERLRGGEIDVADQVPPWLVESIKQEPSLVVGTYRMPTVHVLLCNYENPLLNRREFRRALCYGIDRPRLVTEILAGREGTPGFRALSGPLLAGVTVNDVLGYAYKQALQPLAYEPRLAVVLATAARTALAKQAQTKGGEGKPEALKLPELEPLILVHPTDAVARTMCGLIKKQLDALGIPIELREQSPAEDLEWDLRYAELSMWEPVVDARKLLGPGGLAGRCSPAMNLALHELDSATNWSDARTRLQRVHQLAFDDLPVIPLWQTVNHFAYRQSLTGMTSQPVSLYQDVAQWQISYGLVENKP